MQHRLFRNMFFLSRSCRDFVQIFLIYLFRAKILLELCTKSKRCTLPNKLLSQHASTNNILSQHVSVDTGYQTHQVVYSQHVSRIAMSGRYQLPNTPFISHFTRHMAERNHEPFLFAEWHFWLLYVYVANCWFLNYVLTYDEYYWWHTDEYY